MSHYQVCSYHDALTYLYSFTDFAKQPAQIYAAERYDLRRFEGLLEKLGNPHRRFQSVHIAGTKGKGSTAAMVAAVLTVAGFRTGLFTSPHLHTFCERMRVDWQMIARGEVVKLVNEIAPAVEATPNLTTFELITALAFLSFARLAVDFAVVEVGLGGRLDATNVIEPRVSAITSLSLDHTQVLGDTVAAIAGEKAGIVKPGVPVISAPQPPEAQAVIEAVCHKRHAPLVMVGRDWTWELCEATLDGQTFRVASDLAGTEEFCQQTYHLPLLGRHQLINAALSIAALHALRSRGVTIPTKSILQGLARVEWPARFEVLSHDPMLVVDGAHNSDSARRLCQTLTDYFPGRDVTLIFGVSADKDPQSMLRELLPVARHVIVMQAKHPRAAPVDTLLPVVTALGRQAFVAADADQALDIALDLSAAGDPICASGSLFVAGDVRLAWARRTGVGDALMADNA